MQGPQSKGQRFGKKLKLRNMDTLEATPVPPEVSRTVARLQEAQPGLGCQATFPQLRHYRQARLPPDPKDGLRVSNWRPQVGESMP